MEHVLGVRNRCSDRLTVSTETSTTGTASEEATASQSFATFVPSQP